MKTPTKTKLGDYNFAIRDIPTIFSRMDNVILAFAAQLSPHSDSRNTGSSISTVLMMIMAIIIALNIFDVISSWLYRAMVSISPMKALPNN